MSENIGQDKNDKLEVKLAHVSFVSVLATTASKTLLLEKWQDAADKEKSIKKQLWNI